MKQKSVVVQKARPGNGGRLSQERGGRTNPTCTAVAVRSGQRVVLSGRTLQVDGAVGQFLLAPDHMEIFRWVARAEFGHGTPGKDKRKSK